MLVIVYLSLYFFFRWTAKRNKKITVFVTMWTVIIGLTDYFIQAHSPIIKMNKKNI